ncbi:MAG: hypothetical protein HOD60_11185 [Candidatus Nitrosopelagicus sp.]|nr:hypothetical protein [Candidatus Nitrosopelagicus sp.]
MSKYANFANYLESQKESFVISFDRIEKIIDGKLPDTAFVHPEWWSNSDSHSLMKIVLPKNWKSRNIDLEKKQIEFYKTNESELLQFLQTTMKTRMHSNYMPIVIKSLLESSNHSSSVPEIRKKFEELNFGRDDFKASSANKTTVIIGIESKIPTIVKLHDGSSSILRESSHINFIVCIVCILCTYYYYPLHA